MSLDSLEKHMLKQIADIEEVPMGAYNIRKDGKGIARNTTSNIDIVPKKDKPGIRIQGSKAGSRTGSRVRRYRCGIGYFRYLHWRDHLRSG